MQRFQYTRLTFSRDIIDDCPFSRLFCCPSSIPPRLLPHYCGPDYSVARRESPPTMPGFETAWTPGMAITAQTALAPLLTTLGLGKAEAACYAKIVDKLH